jgi:hypothetical protein
MAAEATRNDFGEFGSGRFGFSGRSECAPNAGI